MKYTKSIVAFLFLNLFLVFAMIFIANKSRDIEKKNNNLKIEISKISEDIKINNIELITHKNSSYLKNLFSIYFTSKNIIVNPNIVSINNISKNEKNLKLVNSKK